ncbi:MAG: glycosyltransferase family 4 protein [Hyphomicrobiales bacterium]
MKSPRVLFLVTDDRYFISHRLPMARAAKAAGYEVHVATHISRFEDAIKAEGFVLHVLSWEKAGQTPFTLARDVLIIRRLYRSVRPEIVNHVALKPVILGMLAAIGLGMAKVNIITGLGSGFIGRDWKGRILKSVLVAALRMLLNSSRTVSVVQNRDDRETLISIGINPGTVNLILGSGIDIHNTKPLAEPSGPITVGITSRMLDDKGIRPLVAAQSILQARGLDIRLLLAGEPDPTNRSTLSEAEMRAFAAMPGIEWLGHIEDVKTVWERAHIAALPSRREGLPKSLLEAAAFGRPIIATNVPGCREVARHRENALLVPVDDAAALAHAIETLANDPELRETFGSTGRRSVETHFSSAVIGSQIVEIYAKLAPPPLDARQAWH